MLVTLTSTVDEVFLATIPFRNPVAAAVVPTPTVTPVSACVTPAPTTTSLMSPPVKVFGVMI